MIEARTNVSPGAFLLVIYGCLYVINLCLHVITAFRHKDNFQAVVRLPKVLAWTCLIDGFICLSLAVRPIVLEQGRNYDCWIMGLISVLASSTFLLLHFMKNIHLLVLLNQSYRSKYIKYLNAPLTYLLCGFCTLIFLGVWVIATKFSLWSLCKKSCHEACCPFQSMYVLTLPYWVIFQAPLLIVNIQILGLEDMPHLHEVKKEMRRSIITSFALIIPLFLIVILVDYGEIIDTAAADYTVIILQLVFHLLQFTWSTMGPSLAYGYSPFTIIARRFQNKIYSEQQTSISKNFYIKRDDEGKILGASREVEGGKKGHHRKQHSFRSVQDASQKDVRGTKTTSESRVAMRKALTRSVANARLKSFAAGTDAVDMQDALEILPIRMKFVSFCEQHNFGPEAHFLVNLLRLDDALCVDEAISINDEITFSHLYPDAPEPVRALEGIRESLITSSKLLHEFKEEGEMGSEEWGHQLHPWNLGYVRSKTRSREATVVSMDRIQEADDDTGIHLEGQINPCNSSSENTESGNNSFRVYGRAYDVVYQVLEENLFDSYKESAEFKSFVGFFALPII